MTATLERYRPFLVNNILVPIASIIAGFAVAAVAVVISGSDPVAAFEGLFAGAFTNRNAFAETLISSIPFVFLGLGVALGFRAGLFNIGAEGQYYIGGMAGVFVGYSVIGLPSIIDIPLVLLAGMAGGFLWAGIAGALKARFGAHEVIVTIMLNYTAFLLASLLINKGVMSAPHVSTPRTLDVNVAAQLPIILAHSRLHAGLFLAILAVPLVWFLIERTTIGFQIRTVGFNPGAARAAGISVGWTIFLSMGLSGALAGLGGIVDVLGLGHHMTDTVGAGFGFDAIAVALVARSNPWGIPFAALLFGALRNGAGFMQLATDPQVSADLISVVQAMVIMFIAAPAMVSWLFRVRRHHLATIAITERGADGV